jgi:hypothetical protein
MKLTLTEQEAFNEMDRLVREAVITSMRNCLNQGIPFAKAISFVLAILGSNMGREIAIGEHAMRYQFRLTPTDLYDIVQEGRNYVQKCMENSNNLQ